MCRSPSPRITVSFERRVVLDARASDPRPSSLCSTSEMRCSSPRRFGSTARPCIGVGKFERPQVDVVLVVRIVQHASKWISSTLATAPMSPGTSASDLDVLLALQQEQVPDLERLAAVADEELRVLGDRALVHAEDADLADERIDRPP